MFNKAYTALIIPESEFLTRILPYWDRIVDPYCADTGKYGSDSKTRILAYFMQCNFCNPASFQQLALSWDVPNSFWIENFIF